VSLRAVLFDAAGTLFDPREPVGETYARVLAEHGAAIPAWRLEDAFARVQGRAEPMVFAGLDAQQAIPRERAWWRQRLHETVRAADSEARVRDFEACFERLFAHFAGGDAWRARPGAAAALAALRRAGLATAVVSNFDHRLERVLEELGLRQHLDTVVRAADAGAAKPDPRPFRLALARLGVEAPAALFVGDDAERDLAPARALGMSVLHVGGLATLEALPPRLAALEESPT
jgi:putative hydrolase of the HAD superfamily